MKVLLDTSAVVGLLERRNATIRDLVARADAMVAVTTITIGELEHDNRRRPSQRRADTLHLAATTMFRLSIDDDFAPPCAGHIAAHAPRAVGGLDAWIGAAAVVHGYDLVTQDAEFASSLSGVDWSDTAWTAPTISYIPVED